VGLGVTCRPHETEASVDIANVTNAERRIVSAPALPALWSAASGLIMALALPKLSWWPLAIAGLTIFFWSWRKLEPRSAFLAGWLGGVVYFCIAFSWFGETAGALVGPLAFAIVLAPALIEGLAFGCAAALGALALRAASRPLAPLAVAAAFALTEAIRSAGSLGVPFGNVAYSQVVSPFAPLAAFVGGTGLTFCLCVVAAYAAYLIAEPPSIPVARTAGLAAGGVLLGTALAWLAWPARNVSPPVVTVSAIQANIRQEIKWTRPAFDMALRRYEAMTLAAARRRPALIAWPETVITTDLNLAPWLVDRFSQLARATGAELVVGSKEQRDGREYNALYLFNKNGVLEAVYRKRRLVPFAETLPAPHLFGKLPYMDLVSRFGTGTDAGVFEAGGLRFAPLICWESAFSDPALDGIRDGAQAYVVSTDDAWFGETAGPYQHAQISQLRAIEAGAWVLRAAATGISGIIGPDGRWRVESTLDREEIVTGGIGLARPTVYSAIGPLPVALAIAALYALVLLARRAA
jgi:apolipoprotein N-acyltransferase